MTRDDQAPKRMQIAAPFVSTTGECRLNSSITGRHPCASMLLAANVALALPRSLLGNLSAGATRLRWA